MYLYTIARKLGHFQLVPPLQSHMDKAIQRMKCPYRFNKNAVLDFMPKSTLIAFQLTRILPMGHGLFISPLSVWTAMSHRDYLTIYVASEEASLIVDKVDDCRTSLAISTAYIQLDR